MIRKRSYITSISRWQRFQVPIGRYLDPFSVSIDISRHRDSAPRSFIAVDSVRLLHCAPGTRTNHAVPYTFTKKFRKFLFFCKIYYQNCPVGQITKS